MGKDCQLAELPERLWLRIVGYLDSKELCHLSQVCRSLNGVAADDRVWQTLFTKTYTKEIGLPIASANWKHLCRNMSKGSRTKQARSTTDASFTSPTTPSSVSSESEPRDVKSPTPHESIATAPSAPLVPVQPPPAPAIVEIPPTPSDSAARSEPTPAPAATHPVRHHKHPIAPSAETQHISAANPSEQNEIVDIEGGDEPAPKPVVIAAIKSSPLRTRHPTSSPPRSQMDVSKLPLRKRFFKEAMAAEFRTSNDSVRSSAGLGDDLQLASSATAINHSSTTLTHAKPDVVMGNASNHGADIEGGVTIAHDVSSSSLSVLSNVPSSSGDASISNPRKARLQAFASTPAPKEIARDETAAPRRPSVPVIPVAPVSTPARAPSPAPLLPVASAPARTESPRAVDVPKSPFASVPAAVAAVKPKPVLKRKADQPAPATAPKAPKEAPKEIAKEATSEAVKPKKVAEAKRAQKGESDVYCLCRKAYDPNIFMIACDVCDEWYHGLCVGVREEDAGNWKSYSCPDCRQESEDVEFEEDAGGAIKSKKKKAGAVPKRCLNSACAQLAKSKSKYCSNACGVAVAREKVRSAPKGEPAGSAEHPAATAARPSSAGEDIVMTDSAEDVGDRKQLEELKAKRVAAEKSLSQIERTLPDLERAIAAAAVAALASPTTVTMGEPTSPAGVKLEVEELSATAARAPVDDMVDCTSCGNPLPMKNLARHLDQCFHPKGKPDVAAVLAQAGLQRDASAASSPTMKLGPKSPTKRDKDLLLCSFATEEFGGGRCDRLRKACTAHAGWEAQRKTELVQEKARVRQLLGDLAREESALLAEVKRRHNSAEGGHTIQH